MTTQLSNCKAELKVLTLGFTKCLCMRLVGSPHPSSMPESSWCGLWKLLLMLN